jgi:hypothetical protein
MIYQPISADWKKDGLLTVADGEEMAVEFCWFD